MRHPSLAFQPWRSGSWASSSRMICLICLPRSVRMNHGARKKLRSIAVDHAHDRAKRRVAQNVEHTGPTGISRSWETRVRRSRGHTPFGRFCGEQTVNDLSARTPRDAFTTTTSLGPSIGSRRSATPSASAWAHERSPSASAASTSGSVSPPMAKRPLAPERAATSPSARCSLGDSLPSFLASHPGPAKVVRP